MTPSIVPQLVKKDFAIMGGTIVAFGLVSLLSIAIISLLFGRVADWVLINLAFVFLLGPAATCGIVLLMRTNVMEKEKSTQAFVMSLPLTVKEFTTAKLLVNLPVFTVFWLIVSAVAFWFAFGRGLLPLGAVPLVTMVFLGVFLAYTCILSTSLLTQSLPMTVLAIPLFEMSTSGYLWTIAFQEPIQSHVYGTEMVWTPMALAVVAVQALAAVAVLMTTVAIQTTKRDFI